MHPDHGEPVVSRRACCCPGGSRPRSPRSARKSGVQGVYRLTAPAKAVKR